MAVNETDWYQKGLQLRQKGHYQKAIHAFNQAIDNKIKFAEAYFD
jgi:tetratricopeptide (TPR) repeat protein